ncbi:hypothetical protein C1S70_32125, partial (plasmid) [Azospirillum argentinense]
MTASSSDAPNSEAAMSEAAMSEAAMSEATAAAMAAAGLVPGQSPAPLRLPGAAGTEGRRVGEGGRYRLPP